MEIMFRVFGALIIIATIVGGYIGATEPIATEDGKPDHDWRSRLFNTLAGVVIAGCFALFSCVIVSLLIVLVVFVFTGQLGQHS